ncbi:MAG: Polyketide cyclase / dehydrase and lipid transport [Frankiales bacterium]|nr:Polyketide cyclase / dehydrase and lipid transport [Frankiales bacterium]
MPDESTQSITIEAPAPEVMAAIADFARYPEWAASVKSTTVTVPGPQGRAKQVAFRIDAGAIRDEFELAYVWDEDRSVSWHLVHGQMQKAQRGSYRLEQSGPRTLVTYTLSVDLAIPMLGMLKRKAEKTIMDTALKELKKRVEGARDVSGSG